MATRDGDPSDKSKQTGRISLPALQREASASAPEDPTPQALGPPEQLGFHLRFEGGRALLALDNRVVGPGIEIKRALFEVPDVEFPLDVSGGAQRFQSRRLTLRAIELSLSHASLYAPERLKEGGFTLLRERSRAGGVELLVETAGPAGPVPLRARGLFAPVGEAGVALVLHELIAFAPLPRSRTELAQGLLDAIVLPGASPARAMVRRAEPFRAVLRQLLPAYGWKVPAVGDVRVNEVVFGKAELTLRAWSRALPEGWKAPKEQKRGPLEEAVALAVFADGVVEAGDDAARMALVDRLVDDSALAASVAPFAAEVLRRDPRRRAEGDDLIERALQGAPEHLGLLSAHAEQADLEPGARAQRLFTLGKAADAADEPWVAARAFLTAADHGRAVGDGSLALQAAEAAFLADPSLPETGALFAALLAERGDLSRALSVGRTALERTEDPAAAELAAVRLAGWARRAEGVDAARVLLRRALRRADRVDALVELIDVEVEAGALERAAELLTRLLVLAEKPEHAGARADVELLAARIAEARGDKDAARMHLSRARELRPGDGAVAVRLALLLDEDRQLDRALEVLRDATEGVDAPAVALVLAARLFVKRRGPGDAERARAMVARLPDASRDSGARRIDAEAQALLGQPGPLAEILVEEGKVLEAARLFVEAGRQADAASALVRAFQSDAPAAAALLVGAARAAAEPSALVVAVAEAARSLESRALHPAAAELLGAGRPRDAHALLAGRDDRASIEERASYAEAAGDVALEIAEREALAAVYDTLPGTLSGGDAQRANAVHRRLGSLHRRPEGRGPAAAADAWQRASAYGPTDLGAWLDAALTSEDPARLATLLRRDDAEAHTVPSGPLREAVRTLTSPEDGAVRLRLSGVLAARAERLDDVEAYLAEARALPPRQAAQVLADAALRHGKPEWLLEGAEILVRAGEVDRALRLLLEAPAGPVGGDRAVQERAFVLARERKDAPAIESSAALLLARPELSREERLAVHAAKAGALVDLDRKAALAAFGAWLDDNASAEPALLGLVPPLLDAGHFEVALGRIEAAARAAPGGQSEVRSALLARAAEVALKRGEVAFEIRARELLLGERAPDDAAQALELERLADLYGEAGRFKHAVDVLERRVALGGTSEALATLLLRIAALEEDQLKDKPRAAAALRGHLRHAPDDASASRRLQALLQDIQDDAGLHEECARRASRLRPGAERTELLLKAGDAAARAALGSQARAAWMTALRSTPWSAEALERLLALARADKNHRLVVRARVAAAQTLADGPAAAEQAAEAGAYLYSFLGRPRLALYSFRWAESRDKKPQRHTRLIIDLHRALGEGNAALAAVDQLLEKAKDKDKPLLLETRAEILEELLHEGAAAAEARRQALELDPRQRTAARLLAKQLREGGDRRGALDVERAYADAALSGGARAAVYAQLAAAADEELHDAALCAELCAVALKLDATVDVLRRYARVLQAVGDNSEAVDALKRLLDANLALDERLDVVRRKAALEEQGLGNKKEARRTLRAGLADPQLAAHPDVDTLVDALARLEEELDDPAAAAALLLDVLAEHPEGTRALGDRPRLLERTAALLDSGADAAREPGRALALLNEAAALGDLARPSELRRARLAEALGQHEVAASALERLLSLAPDAEERVALLGRLALAAERADRAELALSSWQGRVERLPGDVDALRAIERLAGRLGRHAEARAAADALVRIEAGADDERALRLLYCARDSRDRLGDAALATALFADALRLRADAGLRREALRSAEDAADAAAALALLDTMEESGDELAPADRLRRAELRLATGGEAARALADVVSAVDAGATVDERALSALDRAAAAEPEAAARAWLTRLPRSSAGGATADALRAVLPAERLGDPRVALDVVVGLADALPEDAAVATAAATALLAGDGNAPMLLARLARLRPILAERADLRGRALTLLRDQEAWGPVAEVLEDALGAALPSERRALRLELVSVLRTGLEADARAVPHLQTLVDEDADDREAWGELLECLDVLGDKDALASALGRRAERASGIERRELVRRRSGILVELGRGDEALPLLVAVRRDHGGDVELKDLERRIHEGQGPVALGAFLAAELARGDAAQGPLDAERLLALDAEAVDPAARVLAHLRLIDSPGAARVRATEVLEAASSVERRVAEAVSVAERLDGALRTAFLEGLSLRMGALGSAAALTLSDALFARQVSGTAAALGLAAVQRRWRTAGPRRAVADVERLQASAESELERRAAAAAALRLALRLHDAAAVEDALASLSGRAADELAAAWRARRDGAARDALEARAAHALQQAATGAAVVVASVRAGDSRRGGALVARTTSAELRRAASRARLLKLTPERLGLRLALADSLPPQDALGELDAAAAVALGARRLDEAAHALEGLLARGRRDGATLAARADLAWERGEADAPARSTAAADALGPGEQALRHRRKTVEALLRAGDVDALAAALLAFARTAPDDPAVQAEALGLAEASGFATIVDTLMAEAAERSAGAEARFEAVRRRAEHRLHALKDAQGAFEVLHAGAAAGDTRLRDAAYELAVREGLVEAQLLVVDDELARAGLLALLGKSAAALEAAEALQEPAAALLQAEVAALEGNVAREAAALERLFSLGAADAAALALLVGLDRRRGRLDDAAARAVDLIERFGASPERVALLLEMAGGGAAAARVAPALRALLESGAAPPELVDRAVDVWEAAAHLAGLPADVRAARLRRCRTRDEDALWVQFLGAELAGATVQEGAAWLRPLLTRGRILPSLVDALGTRTGGEAAEPLAAVLDKLVKSGDGALVADALAALDAEAPLSATLRAVLASALGALGRPGEAAAVLLAGAASASPEARAHLAREAARLFLEAQDLRMACDALLRLPLALLDDASATLGRDVAERAGGDGALLALRLAVGTADEAFVDQALRLAAAAPPRVAQAVAAWRLRTAPLDERAWRLAAGGGGPAHEHFASALALRGLSPWPDGGSDELTRARRLRERTLSPMTLRAWREQRRPRSALQRARLGDAAERAAAWRELAALAAGGGGASAEAGGAQIAAAQIAAARLLSRAGVPMSEAPIEVRLAADPALASPAARAGAIADALAVHLSSAELSADRGARRQALVAAFDRLDAQGFAGARLRQDVHGGRAGIVGQMDAADLGAGVDAVAIFRWLGRRPTAGMRATAAALLAAQGEEQLARVVDPRLFSAPPPTTSAALLRSAAARAATPRERVGLLRLAAAVGGYDADLERAIQEAAEEARLPVILGESLGRMAGATADLALRAGLLRERAAVRAGFSELLPLACQDAAAAHALAPDDADTARLWLQLAEMSDAPREVAKALGAVVRTEPKAKVRDEAAARRVALLVDELHDEDAALLAVEEALALAPEHAGLLLARGRVLAAMGQERAAAECWLQAARSGEAAALALAEPLVRKLDAPELLEPLLVLALGGKLSVDARRDRVLERATLLHDRLGDKMSALAVLEQQALADDQDLAARLTLAGWYAEERRFLDAALAYESASMVADLPPVSRGPAAREAACLLASLGDLERAGPLAEVAVGCGVVDHKVLAVASAWHRAHQRFEAVEQLLESDLALEPSAAGQAAIWLERARLRWDALHDAPGAKKALLRVLELDPGHEGALALLREDAERDGSFGALRAVLFRAAETAEEPARQKRLLLEIAALDLDRFNDSRAAEATLERVLVLDADDADALVLKARLRVKAGEVQGVATLLERAERAGARDLPGILQLVRGEGLLLSGERDSAREALRKAAADPETASKAWDLLVDMHEGSAELAAILAEARAATDEPKRKVALLRKEAKARHKAGDEDGELACAEQLLALEPGDTDCFKVVRAAYTRKRKPQVVQAAMGAWARAVEGAERAQRLGQLGSFALDEQGDEALAREVFEEALRADASEATALVRLADIAWAARDDERALELMDRLRPEQWQRDPVELAYRRARCAFALGRDDAHERLRAVLRLDAKHQDALEMMVRLSLQRKDDEAAEFALEALTAAIPPREDPVRLAQACLELATLRGRQGRFGDALVAAERAFDLDPTNVAVLEAVAEARGAAGRHLEAAEAWRRASAARTGEARDLALERRALHLARGGRVADAVDLLVDLKRETGQGRFREAAEELARNSGDPQLLRKLGLAPAAVDGGGAAGSGAPRPVSVAEGPPLASAPPEITRTESVAADSDRAIQSGFNALHLQVRANLEENDPQTALRIVEQALMAGGFDEKLLAMGLEAADRLGAPQRFVELIEARLKAASDPAEVKALARQGARVCKERLADPDRAAALLYVAHQADAEDLEVRFELTELYAQIPRLVGHAVTGVLQLLRRTPADGRVFELSARIAEGQGQKERAGNMRAVAMVLSGKGVPYEPRAMVLDERGPVRAFDDETLRSRLAPTGWGGPLHDLLVLVGPALASTFHDGAPPPGIRPLHEVSPRGALALDRLERIMPGRPFRLHAGPVERLTILPGVVATAVIPTDALQLGDTALLAMVARAYGIVRLGAVAAAVIPEGQEPAAAELLRAALLEKSNDPRAQKLRLQLREEERLAAEKLAEPALKGDVAAALRVLLRGADRFALMASGNLMATLHASCLPTLLREPPQRAAAMLQTSPVALELCSFAARDNTWLVRRQHGLSST